MNLLYFNLALAKNFVFTFFSVFSFGIFNSMTNTYNEDDEQRKESRDELSNSRAYGEKILGKIWFECLTRLLPL
jgi:hypothetical protein